MHINNDLNEKEINIKDYFSKIPISIQGDNVNNLTDLILFN
jgi:hypothetical protein